MSFHLMAGTIAGVSEAFDPTTFKGHPRRTISSIDESGGIVCARTTGQTPFFAYASASAILATGTSYPWEDLEYTWDFGDPGSTETFTNPGAGGGGTVNSNSDQRGPDAVHCYRTAGTYTITLTIRGAYAPFVIRKTTTQEITVTTFSASSGEYWFDSVAGNDANDGLSSGAPKQTISAFNTLTASVSNRSFHVKCDSSYDGSVALSILDGVSADRGNLRIDSYGSGAKPRFNISSGTSQALFMRNGGASSPSAKNDIVFSGLHFSNSGTSSAGCIAGFTAGNATATIANVYFDNCTSEATVSNANVNNFTVQGSNLLSKIGFWNCTLISPLTPAHQNMGMYASVQNFFFVVGGSIEGGSSADTFEHHIYPNVFQHSLYRWIDFKSGPLRSYCINTNWGNITPPIQYPEFVLIADNNMTGTDRAHDLSQINTFDTIGSLFRNVVCERNRIHDMPQNGAIFFYSAESYTNRDNEVYGLDGAYYVPQSQTAAHLMSKIYRNKIHRSSNVIADDTIAMGNAAWVLRHEIFDNIIVDMRTSARISAFPYSGLFAVEGNQYYAPNDLNAKFLRDVTTDKTFAEQQAAGYDLTSSVADPGWADAANGDFS